MRSPCVMVLATEGAWGRAPDIYAQTSVHFHRLGYHVIHGVLTDGDGSLLRKMSDIKGLDAFSLRVTKKAPWRALELLPILDKARPDLIIAHLFHSYITARILGRMLRRIPVISVFRSSNQGWARSMIDKMTLGLTEYFVTVSEDGAQYAREALHVPGRKLLVIPPGVDFERMLNPSVSREAMRRSLGFADGDFVIGCVARFHPVKDHATLLRAFKILRQRRPNARLLLVGKGDELPRVRGLTEKLGLLGDVVFAGYRCDVPELYGAMDATCLTSRCEGLTVAALESMAVGLPVVATAAPGLTTLLRHEENSLLAPIGDAVGIAGALETIATQPELTYAITSAARKEVAKFSLVRYLSAYQALVEDSIGPAQPSAQ